MNRILDSKITTAPASTLLDRDTLVKAFLKIGQDVTDEDDLLDVFIEEVREELEGITGYALGAQTRQVIADLVEEIEIPYGPHAGITSVTYVSDTEETELTAGESYYLRDEGLFYRLTSTYKGRHIIVFTTGYTADTLPAKMKGVWLRLVAHRYTHRGDEGVGLPDDLKRSLTNLKRCPV